MQMAVNEIKIGKRFRRDLGDLQPLADSIAKLGLLQPIGILPDHTIIFGERRFRACRDVLKLKTVDVRVLDIGKVLEKERDENEVRKDFTASERVAIGSAIEAELKERERRGRPAENVEKIPQFTAVAKLTGKPQEMAGIPQGTKTRSVVAQYAGFGNETTYRQAKSVVQKGTPELVEAMDTKVVSISAAATLAKKPPEEQRRAVKDPAHYQRIIDDSRKAVQDSKTHNVRMQDIVCSFQEIANSRLSPHEFVAKALPAELDDVRAALPRVREFIAAIEGGNRAKLKAV